MSATETVLRRPALPCRVCGGDGREWRSRYGGNDPDVWVAGPCPECNGSGDQACEDCGQHSAAVEWKRPGRKFLLCTLCHDQWQEDENA